MALAALLLLGLGAALFILTTRTPQQTPAANLAAPTHNAPIAPLLITNKTITLAPSATSIKPNLRLKKGSAAATLKIIFLNAEGHKIKHLPDEIVKYSRTKEYSIPPSAISARFEIYGNPTNQPLISHFAPTALTNPNATRRN